MKLQDMLLKAMAKKITGWTAAYDATVAGATGGAWVFRFGGSAERQAGQSPVPVKTAEKVVRLYRDRKSFDSWRVAVVN